MAARLTTLPSDCAAYILRVLPLRDAAALSATCRALRALYAHIFPALAAVLPLSHLAVSDDELAALCARACGSVRALALAGCTRITADGIVAALRLCPRLQYLDLSAGHPAVVSDATLVRMSPWMRRVRVLRLAYAPQITGGAFAGMVARGFGTSLVTLDLSFSWMVPRSALEMLPALRFVVAPGTRLVPGGSGSGRDVLARANGPCTVLVAFDVWADAVEVDDGEVLQFLLHTFTGPLGDPCAALEKLPELPDTAVGKDVEESEGKGEGEGEREDAGEEEQEGVASATFIAQLRYAYVTACAWDRNAERTYTSSRPHRTTLLDGAAHVLAASVATILVRDCNVDPLDPADASPLSVAVAAPAGPKKTRALRALTPRARVSLSSPHVAALVALAAARRDASSLAVILPEYPVGRPELRRTLGLALDAVFDALNGIPFPANPRSQQSSWLSRQRSPLSSSFGSSSSSDAPDVVVSAVEVVRVLLDRGADPSNGVMHKAASLGEYEALRELILFQTGDMSDASSSVSLEGIERNAAQAWPKEDALLQDRLAATNASSETVLVAAASGECEVLASKTVKLVLDAMCQCTSAKVCDQGAAKSVVAALQQENDSVASLIIETRPQCVPVLVSCRRDAMLCLHAVARRVGRGGAADYDLMLVGRRIIKAGEQHHSDRVSQWLTNDLVDGMGRTALHYAAGASDPTFARSLLRMGVHVDALDVDGATPLCTAIEWHASRACLESLLAAGADVMAADKHGKFALHRAAEARNGAAAAVLIRFGADPLATDKLGVAPVHVDSDLLHRASLFAAAPVQGIFPLATLRVMRSRGSKSRGLSELDRLRLRAAVLASDDWTRDCNDPLNEESFVNSDGGMRSGDSVSFDEADFARLRNKFHLT